MVKSYFRGVKLDKILIKVFNKISDSDYLNYRPSLHKEKGNRIKKREREREAT